MSHFSTIKTSNKLTNPEIIIESLQELGWNKVSYHPEAQPLMDFYEARGRKSQSQSAANIIVPWQQNQRRCSSDFGFVENNGEYTLTADEMDTQNLQQQIEQLQKLYNQKTAVRMKANVIKTAKNLNKGIPIIEETEIDGEIQIKIAFPRDIRQHNQLQQIRR